MMTSLEKQFAGAMKELCVRAKNELGYNPTRFIQLMSERGPVQAARQVITKQGGTYGFEVLWSHGRLDLSVEAHVLRSEYADLFTDEEREICRARLREFNYEV